VRHSRTWRRSPGIGVAMLIAPSFHGELSVAMTPRHGAILGAATRAVWYRLAFP